MNIIKFVEKCLSHIDFQKVTDDLKENERWRNSPEGKLAIEKYWKIARGEISADEEYIKNYERNTGKKPHIQRSKNEKSN